jgi:hypothetical protein
MDQLSHILRKPVPLELFGKVVRVPLVVILFILILVAGIVLTRHLLLKDEWRTFTHDRYNFAITYPASWHAKGYADYGSRGQRYLRAHFNSSVGSSARVLIHQQPMENPELVDAVEWGQEIIARRRPYNISAPIETQVGHSNYPALIQTYKERIIVGSVLTKVVYIVTADSAFMLEFSDYQSRYEKSGEVFDHMLASFRFVDEGED